MNWSDEYLMDGLPEKSGCRAGFKINQDGSDRTIVPENPVFIVHAGNARRSEWRFSTIFQLMKTPFILKSDDGSRARQNSIGVPVFFF